MKPSEGKQTLAHSKSSVIYIMLKDSLSHRENIFKRFILYEIPLISSKYLVLTVHAGALWASFDTSEMAVTSVAFLR